MDGTLHMTEATGTLPVRTRTLVPPLRVFRPCTLDEAVVRLGLPDALAMASGGG